MLLLITDIIITITLICAQLSRETSKLLGRV